MEDNLYAIILNFEDDLSRGRMNNQDMHSYIKALKAWIARTSSDLRDDRIQVARRLVSYLSSHGSLMLKDAEVRSQVEFLKLDHRAYVILDKELKSFKKQIASSWISTDSMILLAEKRRLLETYKNARLRAVGMNSKRLIDDAIPIAIEMHDLDRQFK